MKQTTRRVVSMLLSVLMLTSMLSVFSFAANNYVPDDEYYDQIIHDALIVNSAWTNTENGAKIEYYFRNEIYGSTSAVMNAYSDPAELEEHYETFDNTVHFSSLSTAIDFANDNNIINPVIILCPGVYNEALTITGDVTILGTNAGMNPNIKTDDNTPWAINAQMRNFTSFACVLTIEQFVEKDVEVVFDGVKFINGFTYIDSGANAVSSSVIVRNSVFEGLSAPVNNKEVLNSVFYFEKATAKTVSITFDKVRAERLSGSLIGNYIYKLNISDLYYAGCTAPLTNDIDAFTSVSPEYVIKDSMFYNNVTEFGVLVFDHSAKESSTRTKTELEIANTKFIDGPANVADSNNASSSAITYVVTGVKNNVNIHDCDFISKTNHTNSPLRINFSATAVSAIINDSVKINNNTFIGYPVLNDTVGLAKLSQLDFTGNYYADADGNQADPIYPSATSHNNLKLDYYWIDSEKTVPSNIYYITSIGDASDFEVRNDFNSIHISVSQGESFDIEIETPDEDTEYTVYADKAFTREVTSIDSADLNTGFEKNIYYAVGTSPKAPNYKFVYTVYISTYNPEFASDFDLYNTYMYSPEVKDMKDGTEICKDWDGTSYKFIVGETIFATPAEIFEIADIPTILIPAGVYNEHFCITESAIILGAKHGINPNVPDFENFEKGWAMNEERSNPDKETIFENATIYISTDSVNVTAEVDGITLGEGSGYFDMGENQETYTTSTLKNIYVNSAGGGNYVEKGANGKDYARSSSNVFQFGGTDKSFQNNHKDVRLINIRYENQTSSTLIGTYMESLYIDGLYFAGSSKTVTSGEITSPLTQNFKLEVRNSFFYNCTPSSGGGVLCVNNKITASEEREYNKVIYDHNLFYEPSKYLYGVIGIRFYSNDDSFYFTNNTVISTYAQHSLMPGNSGWFTGLTACESLTPEQIEETAETVTDVVIKYNRICGPYKPIDKQNVKYDTCWDYSYNYVCDLDSASTVGGNFEGGIFDRSTPGIRMSKYSETQKNFMVCNTYYADWDMTELIDAPDSYKNELDYKFTSHGEIEQIDATNFEYTDSVPSGTTEYKFGIELNTMQASYGVYADPDCTIKLDDTVALDKSENVFYIKFASYKNSIVHIYKATITKELSSDADIISIDNHSVSEDTVTAIVPIGTTSLLLQDIVLSEGATYKMFNDAEKTKPFMVTKITNISETPTVKYIEVTSEDKTTVKDYTFTVKQGINTLADITSIKNAVKLDETTFLAYIPVDSNTFDFEATASNGASITISTEGRDQLVEQNETYTIHNIGLEKYVDITVTSESGNTKTSTLIIVKDQSNLDISYIFNMYNNTNKDYEFYTKVNGSEFRLIPVFKTNGTIYELYFDEDCTRPYDSEDIIYLTKNTNVVYMLATAADFSDYKVYKLTIDTNNPAPKPGFDDDDDKDITEIFTDVKKGSWYESFVQYAYDNGLFSGKSETTFAPNDNITRAEFVQVIANFMGAELDNDIETSFDDVESGKWYTGAVQWAYENGIVNGVGENTFAPNQKISREQMCVMIVNAAENYLALTLPETVAPATFTDDASISSWAKASVVKCQKAGIISGMSDGSFKPLQTATRAEACTIFTKCHQLFITIE